MQRFATALLLSLAATSPLTAQDEADLIRQHFASQYDGGTIALRIAQGVLAINNPAVASTGTWDTATEQAFQQTIDTMRVIGFTGLDTNDPLTLTRLVMGWHMGALQAEMGLQDFPD